MKRKQFFFGGLVGLAFSLQAQDRVPGPGDFAGAIPLEGKAGSLLKIEIPEAVYLGLERPDRGDIRVFDADGVMVPFAVRPVPGRVETPLPEEIPFFPWKETGDRALPLGADLELDGSGAVLRIKNQGLPAAARQVYLLDLSGLDCSPAALNLEIESERFFNAGAILFSSYDLDAWREFEKRQIIAWYGDSPASKTRIEMPRDKPLYLLLRFDRDEPRLRRILALFNESEIPPPLRETVIPGEMSGGRRAVEYTGAGFFPLVSAAFRLGETDSLEVRVLNKTGDDKDWRFIANLTLFALNGEDGSGPAYNRPLKTNAAAPFWRIEARGESVFSANVEFRLNWEPQELIFLSRGRGPWTLAYGSRDWGAPESGGLALDQYPAGARAGIEAARITGEIRYRKPEVPAGRDWGQWLLWTILILAVLALLLLAFVTAKSMSKEKNNHE
jgi:hypothetical protein